MTQNTKTDIPDGDGVLVANYVFPDGPGTAVFNIAAGTANLEISCDKVENVKGAGEPMWAIVAAAVVGTPQVYHFSAKVSAVRLANAGGVGTLQVAWQPA